MSDDIVTRLRVLLPQDSEPYTWKDATISQAVDEIERLQSLVEHLSAQLRLQMKANDKAWEAYKEVADDEY